MSLENFANNIEKDTFKRYEELSDEDIIRNHKQEPDAADYMLYRYKGYVRSMARRYYLIGGDCDDLIQEGMIGLYKAIRDFDTEKNVPFKSFAELCVLRKMISAIKAANRDKHKPLNSFVSLSRSAFEDDGEKTLEEVLLNRASMSPEDIYIENEKVEELEKRMHENLSSFENQVVDLYLEGRTYQEMSRELGRPTKSIDNALQRAKSKLASLS